MKLRGIGKSISVFLLLGVFFYATSVKDIHYAFSAKYHSAAHTDHCDHHIHSTDQEEDCFICKMDVLGLLHFSEDHYSFIIVFLPKRIAAVHDEVLLPARTQAYHLRGPPYLV